MAARLGFTVIFVVSTGTLGCRTVNLGILALW